jgi:hypothetical protein
MKLKSIGVDNSGNIKIWNMAVLPRIVLRHDCTFVTRRPYTTGALYTPCIPALLQVSREARRIGLENYEVLQLNPAPQNSGGQLGPIYFNPKLDTLVCADWDGASLCHIFTGLPETIFSQARQICLHNEDLRLSSPLGDPPGRLGSRPRE